MTNPNGRFGVHGGQYIPETLMNAVIELETAYNRYKDDPAFRRELGELFNEYAGRPSRLYYAEKMTQMKEPFMTAVFTASSHHPFVVPEKYKQLFPEEHLAIHKCIRYTDMAIGKFFETASKQPWFKNTIFVMTSDHTNMSDHAEYQTDLGGFCSPIIIYDPSNPVGEVQDKIAQQIDILPTVLGKLGYSKPYFGFGIDVLNTPKEETWAVNYMNGIYQYVKNGYVLQFDGTKSKGLYSLQDSLMQHNLLEESAVRTDSSLFTLHFQRWRRN